ncbi:hypothetical protein HYPDE_23338 [Hyphomicrobium denitrificans 1NES1]|uniref:Uncharacterized protein n=1 Tax=Hyphomicrobium denitrificans 1NES1 TaxID=670307 RepID=N0AYZ5_9HYPH|nr:hypothetical protein HYPDE_23338 [Hyphomicrobium denitrificans 1NES1]
MGVARTYRTLADRIRRNRRALWVRADCGLGPPPAFIRSGRSCCCRYPAVAWIAAFGGFAVLYGCTLVLPRLD